MPISGLYPRPLPPLQRGIEPRTDQNFQRLKDGLDVITGQLNSGSPFVYNVMGFGAKGNGVSDDTQAFMTAISAATTTSGASSIIYVPRGSYRLTTGLTIATDGVIVVGDGSRHTILQFAPTATGTCVSFSAGVSSLWYNGLVGVEFTSTDTAYVKTMVVLNDVRHFWMEDVTSGTWHDTSNASIGLQTNGREYIHVTRSTFQADLPIVHGLNPNEASNSLDFSILESLQLVVTPTVANYNITVVDGSNLSRSSWRNVDCALGAGAIYFHQTLASAASYSCYFINVSDEQSVTSNNYSFVFTSTNGYTGQFVFDQCSTDPQLNGFQFTRTYGHRLRSCVALNTSGTALSVDATSADMDIDLVYETGASISGLTSVVGYNALLLQGSGPATYATNVQNITSIIAQALSGSSACGSLSPDGTKEIYLSAQNSAISLNSNSPGINVVIGATVVAVLDTTGIVLKPGVYTGDTVLIHSQVALTNGAGGQAGTLTTAPSAGNPTKWIPVDDNGTTRYIPAW